MKRVISKSITLLIIGLLCSESFSAPFTSCPSRAFLFQSDPTTVYGVNLATGSYNILQENTGIAGTINAVGFNDSDRYLYGYAKNYKQVVQINKEFQATVLNVTGLPADTHFFVGDTYGNTYYLYRAGYGLFSIDLSSVSANIESELEAVMITAQATVNLTDFAFHPLNNKLYGVDNQSGILYEFNSEDGSSRAIGDTGATGTFGAAYFDVDGYLYLSRNQDGQVFRIDLGSVDIAELTGPTAVLFAHGPSSSQNDGARCANAPIIDESEPASIDFGDAPASYGTLIQDNGARHALDNETFLGLTSPSGKYNGPDNSAFEDSDDDGVGFITPLETGLDSLLQVIASRAGYLNAWFDWNHDGDFDDSGEHIINNQLLSPGSNAITLRVPEGATSGNSWSRFRFSKQQNLELNGGAINGEVEDYPISIAKVALDYVHYPSASGWTTLAYEDNWPAVADYDMNDVIMALRITEVINSDTQMVERIDIRGRLLAMGGSYHSGFAIRLPTIPSDAIDAQTLTIKHNDITQSTPLEAERDEAIFIIHEDLTDSVSPQCGYFRTQTNCDQPVTFNFDLSIPFSSDVPASDLPKKPYDPFIFGSTHFYHGPAFSTPPGRSLEIHLPDQNPTEAFNTNFFQRDQDTSNLETGRFYRTANNLPWAMEMSNSWQWPLERIDLLQAYPSFADFVTNNGSTNANWHTQPNANAIFAPK